MGFDPDCMCGPRLSGLRLDQVLQHRAEVVVVRGRWEQLVTADHSVLDGGGKGGMAVPGSLSHERSFAVIRHGWAPDSPCVGSLPAVDDHRVDSESPARGRPVQSDGAQHSTGSAVLLLPDGSGAAGPLTTAPLLTPLLVARAHRCGQR
eukprot:3460825-Rhodomonas_salina.2